MTAMRLLIVILALLCGCGGNNMQGPPDSPREPVIDTLHGVAIEDPYRWLEEQDSPRTRAWIEDQTAYLRAQLDVLPGRARIEDKVGQARRYDDWTAPIPKEGRYFYTRKSADAQLPVIMMRERLDGEDQVLVDPHGLSPDQTTSVSIAEVSEDGRLLLYNLREGGEDEVVLHVYDVDQRKVVDELPKARYGGIWVVPGTNQIYYARWFKNGPRVLTHTVGAEAETDKLVFGDNLGMDRWPSITGSPDGRYVLFNISHGWSKSELFLQDLGGADGDGGEDGPTEGESTKEASGEPAPPVNITGGADAYFEARFAGEQLVIATDWKASNRRVMAADPFEPSIQNWTEIIPEWEYPIEIDDFTVAGGRIVVHRLQRATSTLDIHDVDGRLVKTADLRGLVSITSLQGSWNAPDLFFKTTTFTDPGTVTHYDLEYMKQAPWAESTSSLFEEVAVHAEQVSYPSKDGTQVTMFLVHRNDVEKNGGAPVLLYGYGGFNVSLSPTYNPLRAVWVEAGGILAVPNLRGGGEYGQEWHEAGMGEHKQNTFDDFIAAAEWLISNGYTDSSKLAIYGGSNGGLLVGAALVQRPELFEAVICSYPLLDMLRYHKFLLGPLWVPEYGSAENPDQFEYLRAYSPYHNVDPQTAYPAILFKTGDGDTRVAPLHAKKMTALMQSVAASTKPVLLHYDTKFGHSAGMPMSALVSSDADVLQFAMWRLGMLDEKEFGE